MNESIINTIYNQTIADVVKNIGNNDINIISNAYKAYLNNLYGKKLLNKDISEICNYEKRKWHALSEHAKMQKLLNDDFYDQIFDISNKAFESAKKRAAQNVLITKEEVENSIDLMNAQKGQIKEYNQEKAKNLISEGTVDLMYAAGLTDCTSLRLSHFKRKKK